MQRIFSVTRMLASIRSLRIGQLYTQQPLFSTLTQKPQIKENLLTVLTPSLNISCGFKVKGRVRRRCQSCYIVFRDERVYNICPKHPRHKQMSMKPKPLTSYILTHATQGKVRPW